MGRASNAIRVLHVDDEPDFADLATTFLEREDDRFNTETATSAAEGLDRLSGRTYDCIVSDYDMPGQSGSEFLETVRDEHPDLPFILFTGKGSEEVASDAISAGVTDYLQKQSGSDQYTLLANRIKNAVERREAQQRLEQAETMFENAQDSFFLIDVSEEFTFERVNPAYEEATGLTNGALSGRTPRDILGDDRGAEIEQKYRECVEDRVELDYEETLSIDGKQTHWETRIAPVVIDGEVEKIVGATRNITSRKQREQKLQLVETLFEHAEECQFIVDVADSEFKLRHANKYYKRTVGLPADEPVTGQTPTDLFGETGGQEILERYGECVETHQSVTYTVELPVPEEGTVYRTILTPVITDDEVTHIVGTARDITELREREQELREERAFIEQSLDALGDVFYVFSADREILRWNDRLSEVTGYPDEEIAGMEPTDFFPEDHQPRIADAVTGIIESGSTTVQADFLTTDGERIPHEFTGFRLTDPDGEVLGFAGIGRDVRRQREYERQLEQRNERLEEFTSIVSHDLQSPLNVADGRLELAREDCESQHLDEVDRALDRMDTLIEDERDNVFDAGYTTTEEGTGFGLSIVKQVVDAHDWEIRVTEGTDGGARVEIIDLKFE
ncbi:PAS domain-containing protein [Halobellus ruber]|uniref:histidine kinase n=1 Tax=Halobellus ruber TaxID=2761102 RepID=A0A7J9SFM9_9EURY|nr:PAS domain-containing protein [Halobellus ruber]MBB6644919.1 PAS domain-containing protein [Halobellus ruber]